MKSRTLEEWVEVYEKKTGQKVESGNGFATLFFPDRGFCQVRATDKMIIIRQLSGDGRFWKQVGEVLAIERGLHHLGTWFTRRNILAYIRLFGFRVERTEDVEGGLKRYHCVDIVTGKPGHASPVQNEGDIDEYFITWEV